MHFFLSFMRSNESLYRIQHAALLICSLAMVFRKYQPEEDRKEQGELALFLLQYPILSYPMGPVDHKRESHANKMKFNSWTVQQMLYTSSPAEGNWWCFVLSF